MSSASLNLSLIITLDSLLKSLSVSKTALELDRTQPAISQALARLREHYQDDLFVQVGRNLRPTPFAESIRELVSTTISAFNQLSRVKPEFTPALENRTFYFVCTDYTFSVLLRNVALKLEEVAPCISLRTIFLTDATRSLVSEGNADFLIASEEDCDPRQPSASLFSDRRVCVASECNSFDDETLTLDSYLSLGHVRLVLGSNTPSSPVETDPFRPDHVAPTVKVFAPTFASMVESVAGTSLLATMGERYAQLQANRLPLRIYEPPVALPPLEERLQWHKSRADDPATVWLRDFLMHQAATL